MLRTLLVGSLLTAAVAAQSPLTTNYTGGYSLAAGATFFVDVVLNVPLTFTQFDVNTNSAIGTSGSLEIRWCPTTYVGNDTNVAAWTFGGSGPVVSAGANLPSPCTITPFSLPPGNYGLAISFLGVGPNYSAGDGTAVPGSGTNQTFTTTEMTLLCGASANGALGTAICCQPRVFSGSIYYNISGSGTIALRNSYGTGCYLRRSSVYESFATSAAFDLSNNSIVWLPSGTEYFVTSGFQPYLAPSASATTLTMTDDSEVIVNLSQPFNHLGGSTNSLAVCSNGYVSVATGNGTAWTPAINTFLNAPQTGWWNWHDYNVTTAGSGQVKFEEVGGIAYVTWDGVYDHLGTSAANANTFQFQFDLGSGTVHLVCETMSALGNPRLVGYSPGGTSQDPGNLDLSAALPAGFTLPSIDQAPLTLTASARPLIGTSIDLATANGAGQSVGLLFFGLAAIPVPGFDLGVIGAGGCPALIDPGQAVGNLIGNLPGTQLTLTLPIPNDVGLIGGAFYSQSVWLQPGANQAGLVTSNGLELVLGNL